MATMAQHRINEQLQEYWQTLHGSRAMPLESEVDITALGELWDHCFLVNVCNEQYAYSYFGKSLIDAYGDDNTGREISETLLYPHSKSLFNSFKQVIASKQPQVDENEFTNTQGKRVKYRSCVMPLGAKGRDGVAFLLGGMKWRIY